MLGNGGRNAQWFSPGEDKSSPGARSIFLYLDRT